MIPSNKPQSYILPESNKMSMMQQLRSGTIPKSDIIDESTFSLDNLEELRKAMGNFKRKGKPLCMIDGVVYEFLGLDETNKPILGKQIEDGYD